MPQPAPVSPSECLMRCLEEFGEHEPQKVLVIYLDADGYVRHRSNAPMFDHERIGLLKIIEHHLLNRCEDT